MALQTSTETGPSTREALETLLESTGWVRHDPQQLVNVWFAYLFRTIIT